jgi:hypothetical protein
MTSYINDLITKMNNAPSFNKKQVIPITEDSRVLQFYIGAHGSGKTRYAGNDAIDVDATLLMEDGLDVPLYIDGVQSPEGYAKAVSICLKKIETLMENGKNHIKVSNNNVIRKEWIPYLELAVKYGYTVIFTTPTNGIMYYNHPTVKNASKDQQIQYLIKLRSAGVKKFPVEVINDACCRTLGLSQWFINNKKCGDNPALWLEIVEPYRNEKPSKYSTDEY